MNAIDPNSVYTVGQVAELMTCSGSCVYNLMRAGELARTRIGVGQAGYRVRGSDILAFLDSRREGGPKPVGSFKYLSRKQA